MSSPLSSAGARYRSRSSESVIRVARHWARQSAAHESPASSLTAQSLYDLLLNVNFKYGRRRRRSLSAPSTGPRNAKTLAEETHEARTPDDRLGGADHGVRSRIGRRSTRIVSRRRHRRKDHRRRPVRTALHPHRRMGETDRRQGQHSHQEERLRHRQGVQVRYRRQRRQMVRRLEPHLVRAAIYEPLHRSNEAGAEGGARQIRARHHQGLDRRRQALHAAAGAVRRFRALLPQEQLHGRGQEEGVQGEIWLRSRAPDHLAAGEGPGDLLLQSAELLRHRIRRQGGGDQRPFL